MKMKMKTIIARITKASPVSRNFENGFFGTCINNLEQDNEKHFKAITTHFFAAVVAELVKNYNLAENQAIDLLDSTIGRHLANELDQAGIGSADYDTASITKKISMSTIAVTLSDIRKREKLFNQMGWK